VNRLSCGSIENVSIVEINQFVDKKQTGEVVHLFRLIESFLKDGSVEVVSIGRGDVVVDGLC
jgi:hypothetical protein